MNDSEGEIEKDDDGDTLDVSGIEGDAESDGVGEADTEAD